MRCRACDKVLKASEIIWREEKQEHEDLCLRCRSEIERELAILVKRIEKRQVCLKYEEDDDG